MNYDQNKTLFLPLNNPILKTQPQDADKTFLIGLMFIVSLVIALFLITALIIHKSNPSINVITPAKNHNLKAYAYA